MEDPYKKLTPMMEQWLSLKGKAGEALLLFRLGDFYEAFFEDAKLLSDAVEVTLTRRGDVPMSGIPWHVADSYIEKLIAKGLKIALAEQVEDPKKAKGLVQREIVRIITPGTFVQPGVGGEKKRTYVVSITRVGSIFGIASMEHASGIFQAIEVEDEEELSNEIYRLSPSEIVFSKKFQEKHPGLLKGVGAALSIIDESRFDHQLACRYLTSHFQVHHLDGYGLKGMVAAINSAGALLSYIQDDLTLPIHHIREIKTYSIKNILNIDRICSKNLELTESLQDNSRKNTLLSVLDQTVTPMGGRLIGEWLKKPLLSVSEIQNRQDAIDSLILASETRYLLKQELKEVKDLERLITKASSSFATPRDLVALKNSLKKAEPLKNLIGKLEGDLFTFCLKNLPDVSEVISLIENALVVGPPLRLSEGQVFKKGYSNELDELSVVAHGGKGWLSRYQSQLRESTGIKSLKVSYNKIFGYFIEVSQKWGANLPSSFQKLQTLVNCERYISKELKEYAYLVLSAEEKMYTLEDELFRKLQILVVAFEKKVLSMSSACSLIDVLVSLAEVAKKNGYCRPLVDSSLVCKIRGGRHPVIEEVIGKDNFIPNDTHFDKEKTLMLITGPNMAGKSTYIRQVALIVILAQMGSFVPADSAHIGLVDRIFSRIGAGDDLARGQSTFMVEMSETAHILRHVTERSLVILDEIGRGTSTYDGVSIACAVSEFLVQKKAKTLFATHYWELTEMESEFPSVLNAHASVQETPEGIIFLHKIAEGGTDKSYGIHVAKLAGLPLSVIKRSLSILAKLEARKAPQKSNKKEHKSEQLTLF